MVREFNQRAKQAQDKSLASAIGQNQQHGTVHRDKDGKIVDLKQQLESQTDKEKLVAQNMATLNQFKSGAKHKEDQAAFKERLRELKQGGPSEPAAAEVDSSKKG